MNHLVWRNYLYTGGMKQHTLYGGLSLEGYGTKCGHRWQPFPASLNPRLKGTKETANLPATDIFGLREDPESLGRSFQSADLLLL
jgi:hypothetical protein